MSKGTKVIGRIGFVCYPKETKLVRLVLNRCAECAIEGHEPWDPFNVSLIIVPNE